VAQKVFQNIFPNITNHSYFTAPNRSRLIETGPKPCTPPSTGFGKKGVQALFKSLGLSRPDSIPRDTKTGKMSARVSQHAGSPNLKIAD
jgi:hypothetical protein